MILTEQELLEIENRYKLATAGPWKAYIEGRDYTSGCHFIMTGTEERRGEDFEISGARPEDFDFIANAKQDIPILISEIRRLKKLVNEV
jgi:hypothetical protein